MSLSAQILGSIDTLTRDFANGAYSTLIPYFVGIWALVFSITLMLRGLDYAINGTFNLQNMTMTMFKALFVLAALLTPPFFIVPIYEIFTDWPAQISQLIVTGNGYGGSNVRDLLDVYHIEVVNILRFLWDAISLTDASALLLYFLVLIFHLLFVIYAFGLLALSKLGLAIFLAVMPLAIFCLMTPYTSNLFQSWFRNTLSIALVPIFANAGIFIGLRLLDQTAADMVVAMNTNASGFNAHVIPFFVIIGLSTIILTQTKQMAGALGSGMSISTNRAGDATYRKAKAGSKKTLKGTTGALGAIPKVGKPFKWANKKMTNANW